MAAGGAGARLLVLLHGLGVNRAVWGRLIGRLEQRWDGRWIAPDLRGHGGSLHRPPYGLATHAADVAALIAEETASDVTLLGHSFGGAVAALVGSGLFGLAVRGVLAFGVKIDWTADEVSRARELSTRPARSFPTRGEAVERYLKASGLHGLVGPDAPEAALGIAGTEGEFRLAVDPRVYAAVGPSIEAVLRLCAAPLRLAAGAGDPMVTAAAMRRLDPAAVLFAGAGHNVHVEAPDAVWQWIAANTHP